MLHSYSDSLPMEKVCSTPPLHGCDGRYRNWPVPSYVSTFPPRGAGRAPSPQVAPRAMRQVSPTVRRIRGAAASAALDPGDGVPNSVRSLRRALWGQISPARPAEPRNRSAGSPGNPIPVRLVTTGVAQGRSQAAHRRPKSPKLSMATSHQSGSA